MKSSVSIKYTLGGREVSQREFHGGFAKSVLEQARQGIQERIRSVRCPVHGLPVEVTSSGDDFQIKGCCEQAVETVRQAFGN